MDGVQDVEDDDYDSAADADFVPETATKRRASDAFTSDESEADNIASSNYPATDNHATQHEFNLDNSGDEATVKKNKSTKRRADLADGSPGLVKTRAQRKQEQREKKAVPSSTQSSVDVNLLWAQMAVPTSAKTEAAAAAVPAAPQSEHPAQTASGSCVKVRRNTNSDTDGIQTTATSAFDEPMVTITRKTEFAGQSIEEERRVPASSAEAQLHLAQQKQSASKSERSKNGLRRPKKRKSAFDQPTAAAATLAGKRLTTLEKSQLDWAAHVDKEGIARELDEQNRSRSNYLGRMDFLSRMDSKRDEEKHG